MSDEPVELNAEELRQKLNLETGKLSWEELQRFFARGVVVVAGPELDLIEVAVAFTEDKKQRIEQWIENDQLARANDEHALQWQARNTVFWSVVVAPWVIVQEISEP
ncbi:MAG: DUF2288 domain-containing protein [Thiohalophilus sp.]|jgi:hypothetical protein